MNKLCSVLLTGGLALPLGAFAAPAYVVTNGNDSGAGTLKVRGSTLADDIDLDGDITEI